MGDSIRFRCRSCGAGLAAENATDTVSCRYCGASFLLPDASADSVLYAEIFQHGYDVEHDQELKDAITWVNKGRPSWSPALSSFGTSLDLNTNDRGMKYIGRFYNLEDLDLYCSKITGKGLYELTGLKKLRKLNIAHTQVCDKDLIHLTGLTRIEYLNLEFLFITDACIEYLEKLPSLEHLNIQTTEISADGYVRLAQLPNMRKLEIDGFGEKKYPLYRVGVAHKCFEMRDIILISEDITDDDIQYLQKYDSIRNLDLRNNKITGTGLKYLKGFERLMSLKLSLNPVTDEALKNLPELPRLRVLEIEYTEVTERGVAMLRKRFPEMRIACK